MPDRRWKRHERETAAALGSTRMPSNVRLRPAIIAGPFAIESKSRETLPLWLTRAMAQARRNAGADQTPLVVLTSSQGRGRKPHRLAVLDFDDFAAWFAAMKGETNDRN